ncbi:class II DAHP synthetase family protein [Penicillium angulare]|uniref:Phospho-2-dehydro-3-deoxyheptonate aldolase n=1 Tax=Penicillium angulare TaxID=116970 RepID=A0A9W9FV11_9EURO|nr:class II DAHP synthetase family protein [Penicillium angulare]
MSSTLNGGRESTCWSPVSWKQKGIYSQQVKYNDNATLDRACAQIGRLPPLVNPTTIDELKKHFAAAARGSAFILVGGDCAENFDEVQESIIRGKYSLLRDQAASIESAMQVPVHIIGRIAGQYAKPRSQPMETLSTGEVVHAFRGHNVNGIEVQERDPDPARLVQGYLFAAATMNCLSAASRNEGREVWSSHEALHLELESCQTKELYNTSAGFLWLGERTRQIDGAHIEYLRGIENPLGVKIGPTTTPQNLLAVLKTLCPETTMSDGRITLITRLGVANVEKVLPPLVQAVKRSQYRVVWMSDPCHGNGMVVDGTKTRSMSAMLDEVRNTINVLRQNGISLGGLHLEQTGEDVNECIAYHPVDDSIKLENGERYRTLCDPRLSGVQARRLVHDVAGMLRREVSQQDQKETELQWTGWLDISWIKRTRLIVEGLATLKRLFLS